MIVSALSRFAVRGAGPRLPEKPRNEDQWFNTGVFAAAPEGRRGNSTVGMVQGPHLQQWDISLRKSFPIQGNTRLKFAADVFNVFNRVNFNNPNTTVTSADFGTINSAGIPRQAQLSLRVGW